MGEKKTMYLGRFADALSVVLILGVAIDNVA